MVKVGKRRQGDISPILAGRTMRTVRSALQKLAASPLSPYIANVYLYGSAARGEQRYDSDVDLFIELSEGADTDTIRDEAIRLRGNMSPDDISLPEADVHIVVGNRWKSSSRLYYRNIQREGIEIWNRWKTRT